MFGRRLPITKGTLKVPAISGTVIIRRDEYGIPYIEAATDDDVWYGMGFCQGQDRAFQIETLLRAARGTLAEILGSELLSVDRLSRHIGFTHAAEEQLALIDDESRRTIEYFARGVTDGSQIGCRRKAHEFSLLHSEPSPFLAADALAITKLISFNLASNWDLELARLKILKQGSAELLAALDSTYSQWHPVTDPPGALAGKALDCLAEDLALYKEIVGLGGGSNCWALAPSHTTTGRPILANDAHLLSSLPPFWYLASLRSPNLAIAGACLVGTPVFPVAHNDVAAWGITAGYVDNSDLFIEEIGPDGQSVRQGDQFIPCKVRTEIIKVKNKPTLEEEVLIAPRGPIISPALKDEITTLSLSATWLAPRPIDGVLDLYRARDFHQFRRAFEHWPFLSLNVMYADTSANIGWQLVGEAPRRRKGWGIMPLPGWDPQSGWEEDPVPYDDMPYLVNPEAGFVSTANNKPTVDGAGPFLGADWLDGFRQARIVEMLSSRRDWDLASVQALQMDQLSLPWRDIRDIVLSLPANTVEARQGLALLREWDGIVSAYSSAATIFELFIAEMVHRIVQAQLPDSSEPEDSELSLLDYCASVLVRRLGHLLCLLREQPHGWFQRPWAEEMADALTTVVSILRKGYGRRPNKWAWGRLRPLTLCHPAGEHTTLAGVFNIGPFPWGGDCDTLGVATASITEPLRNPETIASLRMVLDVGNWEDSRFALPGGQSGNPLSPHYDDLLPYWKRGEGVPIAWSTDRIAAVTKSTLRLEPA